MAVDGFRPWDSVDDWYPLQHIYTCSLEHNKSIAFCLLWLIIIWSFNFANIVNPTNPLHHGVGIYGNGNGSGQGASLLSFLNYWSWLFPFASSSHENILFLYCVNAHNTHQLINQLNKTQPRNDLLFYVFLYGMYIIGRKCPSFFIDWCDGHCRFGQDHTRSQGDG